MAGIVEVIYRNYIYQYKRILLILFLCILFIIASVYAYKWYAASIISKKPYDDVANANRRKQPVDILFFSTTWCPHCQTAQAPWADFKSSYNGKEIKGYVINCVDVDCTNDKNDANVSSFITKYNIEHYPTIKMVFDGDVIDYEASISKSSLSQFVDTILK